MKFHWQSLLVIVTFAAIAAAHSDDQSILYHKSLQTYPGFDLDLNALRWVQLEGQDPVLMTELEKVSSNPYTSCCFQILMCRSDQPQSCRCQVL